MRLLTRYLLIELGKGYLLAALALVTLFFIFGLVREIDNLGEGSYRLHHAAWYVGMTSFNTLLDLLPFVAFLGGLLALSNLARRQEMLVMSTAGLSILHGVRASALASGSLALFALILGQWLAPPLYKEAALQRMLLKSGSAELLQGGGFWVRGDQWYLKAERLGAGKDPESILILEFTPQGPLARYYRAASAEILPSGNWALREVESRVFDAGDSALTKTPLQEWAPPSSATRLTGGAPDSVRADAPGRIQPLPLASLSLSQLSARVSALRADRLPADDAELLLWQRLLAPFAVVAMGLLIMPLVFGDLRSASFGLRLAIGSGVGIGMWVLGDLTASVALLISAPTFLSAVLPILLIGCASWASIRYFGRRV